MITQGEFLALLEARPEMKRAMHAALSAIVEARREAAKNKNGRLAQFKLKRKGLRALVLIERFIGGFVHYEHAVSEEERETIRGWLYGAADLQMADSAIAPAP